MAVQPLASQVGVAPACRALGVPRLPSTVVRGPLPGISSPVLRPPGPCVRPNARTSSTCSPARASSTGHRPRSSRRCSMKASICAPSARCTGSWPRTSRCESGAISAVIPATPSPSWWPRAPTRPGPGISPGSGGPNAGRLLPLCLARHLQPLRRGLDGCRSGERRARRDADRGNLSQARHRAPGAHPAFGPRRADDQQVYRPTPRRPRGHPLSEPPPGQRRQPVLRSAVQDPEVSPRLPWALRRHYRRHRLLPVVLPLVQHRARHAGIAMLTPNDVHHHRAPDVLAQRGRTLQAAWALHPERFVHGTPKPAPLPEAVWINPPATSTTGETSQ